MEHGLTTRQALENLHEDLASVLKERKWTKTSGWSWVKHSLDPFSPHTTLSLPSISIVSISAVTLVTTSALGENSPIDGLAVLFLLFVNIAVVLWESQLRGTDIYLKADNLISSIGRLKDEISWTEEDYPHISSPVSPCISLQWVYRDGHVVNLPWALLVRGDVIVLRPGQVVPGYCTALEDKSCALYARDIFNPQMVKDNTPLPAARAPLENKLYLLHETPYCANLRLTLLEALKRPTSYHDKERHLIVTRFVEHLLLPVVWVLTVFINLVRLMYLPDWQGDVKWYQLLVMEPLVAVLPLMPLILPLMWRLAGAWGLTQLRAVVHDTSSVKICMDPFEDADVEARNLKYHELWGLFMEEISGKSPLLSRSSDILHVLGSVTALCCVDKKGILSWPNPTAEKVFFLRHSDLPADHGSVISEVRQEPATTGRDLLNASVGSDETVAEVMDLTHDHTSAFRLQFDDHDWKQYLSSLKPLGLAILLNTCNAESHEVYSQFCCHLSCEASHDESLVPVTNRRCLCELAAQIGFMEQAQEAFVLEQILCTFQHVKLEMVKRDIKFARQLSKSTKLKFPFPHMVATVLRDKQTGCLQLMTQGTADVILDSCVEYWDGNDLHPLTPCDRKKILDFYQRTSLTSNCTAFAYRPLSKMLNPSLANMYLEVASDSKSYLPYTSPTPQALSLFEAKWRGILAQFHSSDSLLGNDIKDEQVTDLEGWFQLQSNQIFIGMVTMQYQAQPDVVQLVEQLERACIRFVHFSKENELRSRVFSEKMGLESGWNCHISLLTDRTRSEGAASGVGSKLDVSQHQLDTNSQQEDTCITSPLTAALQLDSHLPMECTHLLSTKAISISAPSAINTDLNTVKFEDVFDWVEGSSPMPTALSHRDGRFSQDSGSFEDWRSVSCLTHSSDQSVPFAFDISNRAKLPRGIEKIRPHLECIDNVPLQVSLFTDCTAVATKEMLHIMQDYGEVVCVFGSAANFENIGVFLQADASIAMEPLYPQVCQKQPISTRGDTRDGPSPVELSRALNSLPCVLSIKREDSLSLFQLIATARHFCLSLRNSLQFWLCCVISLTLLLFLSSLLMLPPPLNSGQVLFISCIIVPILSASLLTQPLDQKVMQTATGKNHCVVDTEVSVFVLWCYGLKCLPSALFLILVYVFGGLSVYLQQLSNVNNSTYSIFLPTGLVDDETWTGWGHYKHSILFLQHCCSFIFVLHWVAACASFVHRNKPIWCAFPGKYLSWVLSCLVVVFLQVTYSAVTFVSTSVEDTQDDLYAVSFPWYLVTVAVCSPLFVLAINEAVKWQEIKVNKRYQRRKRLDFGTKLGMNSPF